MAREVKIFFRGGIGAASARAILAEAGCGSDVAVMKDPYARLENKLTDAQVEMLAEMATGFRAAGVTVELMGDDEGDDDDDEGGDDENEHSSHQVDEVTVTLQANDARLPALIAILDRHAIPWLDEGLTDAPEA